MKSCIFIVVCFAIILSIMGFQPSSYRYRKASISSGSSLKMNMFDRFFRVVKSNVNGVLSNLEDPEKVLDQAVVDMNNDLVRIRQSYAEISASQKRMEKQVLQATNLGDEWYKRAQLALSKDDEELAREALNRRQIQVTIADDLNKAMASQSTAIEKLYSSMTQLDSRISEAKRQKDTFIARARTAKTSVQVTDMLNSLTGGGSNSMEAFDRMKVKVENLETKAEVAGELAASSTGATSPDMESRFKALEGNSKIEDELSAMKRALPGAAKVINQLPAGGSVASDNAVDITIVNTATDKDFEKLKAEMNK